MVVSHGRGAHYLSCDDINFLSSWLCDCRDDIRITDIVEPIAHDDGQRVLDPWQRAAADAVGQFLDAVAAVQPR